MTSAGMWRVMLWSVMGLVGRKRFMMMMIQQTPALTDSKVENEIKSDHVLVPSKEKQSKKEISIG